LLFAASQDGNGAWVAATVTNNTFTFNIASGRGGVVYVHSVAANNYSTVYFYGTQAELNHGNTPCPPAPITKSVNGTVANLGATQLAYAGVGGALTSVTPALLSFTLQNVPDGVTDAIASRVSLAINGANFIQTADRAIIRRGINPAAGSTLPVFDFNAAEAVTPVARNLTINNMGTDQLIASVSFLTSRNAAAPLYSELQAVAAVTRQIPTLTVQAGDLHAVSLTASAGAAPALTTRSMLAYFSASADKTFTFGPVIGAVTVSNAATAPSVRLRAQYTVQPEYNKGITVNYNQSSAGVTRGIIIGMTEAYLAGSTTFDHSMADLTGLTGWQAIWSLVQAATQWALIGVGSNGTIGAVDGAIQTLATRHGTITP
jgi:hypothetical protein